MQENCRKSFWGFANAIGDCRLCYLEDISDVTFARIILHNMIVEDETHRVDSSLET